MQLEEVVDYLSPRLYRYFQTCFREKEAYDLVQETFLRLWAKKDSIDPRKGNLIMYTYGIAANLKREKFRKNSVEKEIIVTTMEEQEVEEDIVDRLSDRFRLIQLRRAISVLKEVEREALSLAIDDNLKISEIAQLMKIPIGTVKSHIHRAKENLKRILISQTSIP